MKKKKHFAGSLPAALLLAAFCAMGFAQEGPQHQGQNGNPAGPQQVPPTGQAGNPVKPGPGAKPSPAMPAQGPGAPAPPAQAPSLLDHPAQAPKVNLAQGKLSVQANNCSLSEILHQISRASGMKIEGLQTGGRPDQRVFGSYGPGAPPEVLSELLDGAGYNVLMLGRTSSGAPKELALTPRSAAGAVGPHPQQTNNPQPDNGDNGEEDVQPTQYQDDQPQQNYIPPPGPPEIRRTPQQLLEELQRTRQQQQQPDQNQQPDQQPQEN